MSFMIFLEFADAVFADPRIVNTTRFPGNRTRRPRVAPWGLQSCSPHGERFIKP